MNDQKRIITKIRGTGGLDGQVVESVNAKGDRAYFSEVYNTKGERLRNEGPYSDQDEADINLSMFMEDERRKAWGKGPKIPRAF